MTAPPGRPSPAVIAAVRQSLQAVSTRPVALAEIFYRELFAMEPRLREAFPADMSGQMLKMTDAIVGAIAALDEPDIAELETVLRALGRTHAQRFGVEAWQYGYIGHALTRAVREIAGPSYSGSLSSSWISLYRWVAAQMLAGADESGEVTGGVPDEDPRSDAERRPVVPAQIPRPIPGMPQPRRPRDSRIVVGPTAQPPPAR